MRTLKLMWTLKLMRTQRSGGPRPVKMVWELLRGLARARSTPPLTGTGSFAAQSRSSPRGTRRHAACHQTRCQPLPRPELEGWRTAVGYTSGCMVLADHRTDRAAPAGGARGGRGRGRARAAAGGAGGRRADAARLRRRRGRAVAPRRRAPRPRPLRACAQGLLAPTARLRAAAAAHPAPGRRARGVAGPLCTRSTRAVRAAGRRRRPGGPPASAACGAVTLSLHAGRRRGGLGGRLRVRHARRRRPAHDRVRHLRALVARALRRRARRRAHARRVCLLPVLPARRAGRRAALSRHACAGALRAQRRSQEAPSRHRVSARPLRTPRRVPARPARARHVLPRMQRGPRSRAAAAAQRCCGTILARACE